MNMLRRSARRTDDAGFSLLELMLVLVILLIITTAIFRTLTNGVKTFDAELANAEAQENARYAAERIAEIVKTSGNNPLNIIALNNLNFIKLYTAPSTGFNPVSPGTPLDISSGTATGEAVRLLSDFTGDAKTDSDVSSGGTAQIFSTNIVTSEDIYLYLDKSTNLVMLYNNNAPTAAERNVAIAEFVTDLKFTLNVTQNKVIMELTARSNRAAAIENIYERRFRYSNLVSEVRLRNR